MHLKAWEEKKERTEKEKKRSQENTADLWRNRDSSK